jgi:hypothetical protein
MALPQKFPRCRSRSGDGANPLKSNPSVETLSCLVIALLNPASGYGSMLTLGLKVLRLGG